MANAARRARKRTAPAILKPTMAVAGVLALVIPAAWLMLRDGDGPAEAAGDSVPFSTMTDDRYPTEPVAGAPSRTPSATPSRTPSETPSTTPSRTPTSEPSTVVTTTEPTLVPTPTTTSGRHSSQTKSPKPTTSTSTPSPTPTGDGDMTDLEQARFEAINTKRAQRGCAPVLADSRLTHAARAEASYMDDSDNFDHDGGGGPRSRMEGEGVTADRLGEKIQAGDGNEELWNGGVGDAGTDCAVKRVGIAYDGGDVCMNWFIGVCTDSADPIWVEDYSG